MSAKPPSGALKSIHRKHIMIDIETLGLIPESVILSIGAVCFIPSQTQVEEMFYVECDVRQPRVIDTDTVKWWHKQSTPMPIHGEVPLRDALLKLYDFVHLNKNADNEIEIWANGTDFDIAVLYNAYRQFDITPAWKYSSVRDYRTMSKMFPHIARPPEMPNKHNALNDAYWQTNHLSAILMHLDGMIEKWEKDV